MAGTFWVLREILSNANVNPNISFFSPFAIIHVGYFFGLVFFGGGVHINLSENSSMHLRFPSSFQSSVPHIEIKPPPFMPSTEPVHLCQRMTSNCRRESSNTG